MTRTWTVRRGSCLPLLLAAFALLAVLPAPASGAGWLAVDTVAPAPGGAATVAVPRLAADASGNQVAVWIESPAPFKVRAAVRPAGAAWGAPQTLASVATGQPTADVAVDQAGNFIVLFTENTGTHAVKSAYLPAGATTFGTVQTLETGSTGALSSPAVAFDGQGRAFATYLATGGNTRAFVRAAGAGSAWASIGGGLLASGSAADLAVSPDGEATLVEVAGGNIRYQRRAAAGGNWAALAVAGGAAAASGVPRIAVDAQGRTTAVYLYPSTFTGVGHQTCPAGPASQCAARANFTPLATVSVSAPALAMDANSNAVAAWAECNSPNCNGNVGVSRRTGFSGTWGAAVQHGPGNNPAVAIDPSGNATALVKDATDQIDFSFAAAGAPFTGPAGNVSATGRFEPQVATAAGGDVFALWRTGAAIEGAVYDTTPPVLGSISAPAAIAGSAGTFEVTASELWSGVTVTWDFGDGGSAVGPSVTHTYAAPGTYSARVTATDGVGNQASQTQTVTVTQAPVPQAQGLPRPIAGKTVNLERVEGVVLVKAPGASTFVPLVAPAQVAHGAIIDARKGRVRITIDNGLGGLDTADFYGGLFRFTQPRVKPGLRRFANLYLHGGSFRGCPRAPRKPRIAGAAGRKPKRSASRSVRHLWGEGQGAFRSVGRFSSATVRGTTWLVDDKCNATLTRVRTGKVGVRDFVKRRTIVIRAGRQYFARASR